MSGPELPLTVVGEVFTQPERDALFHAIVITAERARSNAYDMACAAAHGPASRSREINEESCTYWTERAQTLDGLKAKLTELIYRDGAKP